MLISLDGVFGTAAVLPIWTHGGAAPIRQPVCPALVPCHCHVELLQPHQQLAHVGAGANPDPAVLVCVQASPHLPSLCAISYTVSTKVYRARDL